MLTDSRYPEQARLQLPADLFGVALTGGEPALRLWLGTEFAPGDRIAYLPQLHAISDLAVWEDRVGSLGAVLEALPDDPFDCLWPNRPAASHGPARHYDLGYAGRTALDKLDEVAAIVRFSADSAFLAGRDSNAWLLNIRGGDLPDTPVADAMSLVHSDGTAELFLHHPIGGLGERITVLPLADIADRLPQIAGGKRVMVDPNTTNARMGNLFESAGAQIILAPDPCELPKAIKNPVELAAIRQGHLFDGVALVRFLKWLDEALAPRDVSEMEAQDKLLSLRRLDPTLTGLSFPTISAAGPHAAITHYGATPATDRSLKAGRSICSTAVGNTWTRPPT